jgi:hypothetical protein
MLFSVAKHQIQLIIKKDTKGDFEKKKLAKRAS